VPGVPVVMVYCSKNGEFIGSQYTIEELKVSKLFTPNQTLTLTHIQNKEDIDTPTVIH